MLVLRASRFRSRFFLSKEALGTRMKIGNGNVNDLLANRIVILNFGSKMAAELEPEPLNSVPESCVPRGRYQSPKKTRKSEKCRFVR